MSRNQIIDKHVQTINQFSSQRNGTAGSVITSLSELCRLNVSIQIEYAGSHYCAFCQKWEEPTSMSLGCKHLVHTSCLQQIAIKISNNTFDPGLLMKICCPKCKIQIAYSDFTRILGRDYIDKKMTEAAMKIAEELERQDRQQRRKQIEARRFPCPVCLNDFTIDKMITFSCLKETHRYCKTCATESVVAVIKQGKFSQSELCCQQCKSPIEEQILKNLLSDKDFNNLMTLRHKNLKVQGLDIHPCAGYLMKNGRPIMVRPQIFQNQKERDAFQDQLQRRCNAIKAGLKPKEIKGEVIQCPGLISYNSKQDNGFIECIVCGLQTCIKGCESAHRGSTCQRYAQWKKIVKMSDRQAQAALRQQKMQKCPRCKMIVLKEQGCHHITCRCGEQFCYVCGALWVGHNNCPGR